MRKIIAFLCLFLVLIACNEQKTETLQPDFLVIDENDIKVSDISPNLRASPKFNENQNRNNDSILIFDFKNDLTWDIELLAIKPNLPGLFNGIGLRAVSQNNGMETYYSAVPFSLYDTIGATVNWTKLTTEVSMIDIQTSQVDNWRNFKYLVFRQYDQNRDINYYYWVKLKIDKQAIEVEIDSYLVN